MCNSDKNLESGIMNELKKISLKTKINLGIIKDQYDECVYTYMEHLPNRKFPFYEMQALKLIKDIYK